MKIYIVTGYAEYFYPKVISSFAGLVAKEGQVHVPQLAWMLSAETSALAQPYHTPMFVEGEVSARTTLLSSYLEDTTKPGTPIVLLFPDDSLSATAHGPATSPAHRDRHASLTHALRQRFGETAVALARLSLGHGSERLLAQIENPHAVAPQPPKSTLLTCAPDSPLFDAMRRNFTHNAVRLAMSSVLENQDRVFEPGHRPTLIADALDRQGMRLKVDTTHGDLLRECEELLKRQWLFIPSADP